MFLFKLVRKIFAALKSDMTPAQIAVAVFLGVTAGLTPAGLHWLLIFTLALLFNCSMAVYFLSWGTFKLLFLAIAPLAFRTGTALLGGGHPTAEGLVAWLSGAPILAFMGFDRYLVVGGYALALPIALAAAVLVRVLIPVYRKKAAALGESAGYQKASKFFLFRFLHWIIAGKDKALVEPKKRFILFRPFRPYMVVAIPLLYIGLSVGSGLYVQWTIKGLAVSLLGKALGVQPSFSDIKYSFFGQELGCVKFELPDPEATKENMVQVGALEADLGFLELLSGRVHVEKLSAKDIALGVARSTDGKLNVTEVPAAKPAPDAPPAEKSAYEEYAKWIAEKDIDWAKWWQKTMEYRKKSAEAKKKEAEKPAAKVELGFDPKARWNPPRRVPLFRVDLIEVQNLSLKVTDRGAAAGSGGLPPVTQVSVQGKNLSFMPGWNGQPLELNGQGKLADGKSGTISFKLAFGADTTDGDLTLSGVPLVELKSLYEKSLPVAVQDGAVTVATAGKTAGGAMDATAKLRLEKLKVASRPENPKLLGLDEQTTVYAIQGINAYGENAPIELVATIKGPVDAPKVDCDVELLKYAKEGLKKLGKAELQKYITAIEGQAESVQKLATEKLAPVQEGVKKTGEEAIKAIQTGDTKAVQESIQKTTQDVKSLPDAKKDLDQKKDAAKEALDLFKKKKKE